jgi:hypothetical protein
MKTIPKCMLINRNRRWVRRALGALPGIALYVGSFFLPTFAIDGPPQTGWEAFWVPLEFLDRVGVEERVVVQALTIWLPNPLFWFSSICLVAGCPRVASVAAILAALFASYWLLELHGLTLVGAYVWLASMALLAVAALAACTGMSSYYRGTLSRKELVRG